MSRPENTQLKAVISLRAAELRHADPLISAHALHEALAEEFKLPGYTIRYNLRRKDSPDGRRKYTPATLERMAELSRTELRKYATLHGIGFEALYATVWRHKTRSADSEATAASTRQVCEILGRLDVARLGDLKSFGFTKQHVKEARQVLAAAGGFELLAPNYIQHAKSHKFYILSLSEQHFLLTNPRRFLKANAAHLSANWKSYDPSSHYFVLVDTRKANPYSEGVCVSTHNTLEGAAAAQHSYNLQPIPCPSAILRRMGGSGNRDQWRFKPGEPIPKRAPDVTPSSVIEFIPALKQPLPPPPIEEPEDHVEIGEYEIEGLELN